MQKPEQTCQRVTYTTRAPPQSGGAIHALPHVTAPRPHVRPSTPRRPDTLPHSRLPEQARQLSQFIPACRIRLFSSCTCAQAFAPDASARAGGGSVAARAESRTRRRAGGSTVRHSFGASAGASGECPRGRRLGSVSEEARRCVTEVCVGGVSGRPPLGSVSEEAPAPSRRPSFAGPSCACAPAGSGGGRCGGSE